MNAILMDTISSELIRAGVSGPIRELFHKHNSGLMGLAKHIENKKLAKDIKKAPTHATI